MSLDEAQREFDLWRDDLRFTTMNASKSSLRLFSLVEAIFGNDILENFFDIP
jgi:hypothetical protein